MPELPEAEHARNLLSRLCAGRTIEEVWCEEDPIVFDGVSAASIEETLRSADVVEAHRRGKYIWLELANGPHPIFHLGMTGTFRTEDDAPLVLSSSPKKTDRSWPPRFTKIRFRLGTGVEIAMTNARRLGRVFLRDDPRGEPPLSKLGFDPLTDMPTLAQFRLRLARRSRAVLKGLLLDQKFAAGVGNWIADEVLYQAALDPRRRVGDLSQGESKRLHGALRRVIKTAVKADARKAKLPKTWLFHHRWHKDPNAKTARGERVEHLSVAGRTTAWVPTRQS